MKKSILVIVNLIFLLFPLIFGGVGTTYAATADYTNVLDDLRTDTSFNVDDYPDIAKDYSLQVIQVAESENDELLIYVYQPAAQNKVLVATSINMSLNDSAEGMKQYNLTPLNKSGVFQKYRVDGVKVSLKKTRYYNIASIYRAFNSVIDGADSGAVHTNEKAFEVGQLWTAETVDNNVTYTMSEVEVIVIEKQTCGFIRYGEGVKWNTAIGACDAHFVAFSTDRDIDKLLAARVSFVEQTYSKNASGTSEGEPTPNEKYILDGEYASTTPALYGKPKSWERIQTGAEFAESTSALSEEKRTDLAQYDFVLNFYETTYEAAKGSMGWAAAGILFNPLFAIPAFTSLQNASGTWVSEVAVLELTFEKDGQTYTLGVVGNKTTGSREPVASDPNNTVFDLFNTIKSVPWWVWLIVGIVVVGIVLAILSIIFPPVWSVVKYIALGLWYIIASPGYLIAFIVKKASRRTGGKKSASKPRTSRSKSTRTSRAPKAKKKQR